jgi:cytochrome c oxidase subunit 2
MKRKLTTGTFALSGLLLAATTLGGTPGGTLSLNETLTGNPKPVEHFEVTASRFSFEPHEITVKKGEPTTITLHSSDVTHGLVIEELGIRSEVKKGQSEDLTITPGAAGTFEGRCAHFCGKGHASMTLTVHVVE